MTETEKIILDRWQVRKKRSQKTAFLEFMQSRFPEDKLYEKNEFYLGKILFTGQLLPMES